MMSSSAARQALLETITERERELVRIRIAADNIIEEEQRESTKQLQSLKSELGQYQSLLQEKDDVIQSLHSQMEILDNQCITYQNQINEKSKEDIERQVERITKRIKCEYEEEKKSFEEQLVRKLRLEFEDKLGCCEKKIHGEYQTLLLSELQNQEEVLWSNFDKIMREKETQHDTVERELRIKLKETEKDFSDMSQRYDRNLGLAREKLLSELTAEREAYSHKDKDYEKVKDMLIAENEQYLHRNAQLEEQLLILDRDNSQYEAKVQQLLDVIQCAEENYVHKLQEFEERESEHLDKISLLSNDIATFQEKMKEIQCNHHAEIRAIKKRYDREKKEMKDDIDELREEIKIVERVKCDNLEKRERIMNKKGDEIKYLSEELENTRQQLRICEDKKATIDRRKIQLQNELESKSEKVMIFEVKMNELKDELNKGKAEHQRKLNDVIHERDSIRHEKENIQIEVSRLQDKIAHINLESKIGCCDRNVENESLNRENKLLKKELDKSALEKTELKDTVAIMRKEMEKAMRSQLQDDDTGSRHDDAVKNIGNKELRLLNKVNEEIDKSISCIDDIGRRQLQEVLDHIRGKLSGTDTQKIQDSRTNREKIERLERTCRDLSMELQIVSSENKRLIELSKKLQSDKSRMTRDESSFDGIDFQDFAQGLWSKAIGERNQNNRIPLRTSERATASQKLSLEGLRQRKVKKSENEEKNRNVKVRNWNHKEDR